MPDPPRGEAALRALSERFSEAERRIRALLVRAPKGDRRGLLIEAVAILIALRRLDFRAPVVAAYLAAFRAVRPGPPTSDEVADLAGSLAQKLDGGAQAAARNARAAFRTVTEENLEEVAHEAVTAHVDARGTRWPLDAWAEMNTQTIGRQASSRGLADAVGTGGKVNVQVGACELCKGFAGEAVVGTDPLPPFHPSCTCTASAT